MRPGSDDEWHAAETFRTALHMLKGSLEVMLRSASGRLTPAMGLALDDMVAAVLLLDGVLGRVPTGGVLHDARVGGNGPSGQPVPRLPGCAMAPAFSLDIPPMPDTG